MRLPAVSVCLAAALVGLAACQDATGVGLDLLGDDAGAPAQRALDATLVDTVATASDVASTAGFASASSTQPQARVLVGRVADAVFGDAEATAYLDATRGTLPSDFDDNPITTVTIELVRDYTYGDTTAALPVEVRFVTGNWSPAGLPADTVLGTGAVIATASLAPADSVSRIVIPAAALAGRDTVFTSTAFETSFEGFALSSPAVGGPRPGAVAGFDTRRSRLRVATREDTLTLTLNEVYSLVRQQAPTLPPAGVLPIRSGAAQGALEVGFDLAALGATPLARAQLALTLDPTLSQPVGTFRRPLAASAAVYALPLAAGEDPVLVTLARRTRTGELRTTSGTALTSVVQALLLGQSLYEPRFEVRVPATPASLDILPVVPLAQAGATPPRLLLTVVAS